MGSEWRSVKFSDVCDIWRGGSPRPIHEWVAPQGIPWVKISDATSSGSRYIEHTNEFIRPEGRTKSREVVPGDLILSNSATPGIPMFMALDACIHDGWLLLRNFRGIDKLFCYYLLLYERPNIVRQGTGSVFTNLKTDILKNHVVSIPSLPEQRAIAAILGALDDKIELNRRMNATLEGIARALFKSWFVDFDPVRAKAEGRRMKDEIAALFPDALVDSELGEIPRGWKMAGLHTVATLKKEAVQPMRSPAKLWEHYSIPAFDTGRIPVIEAGTNIKSGKYRVPPTSVLVSKLNPQFPRIWLPDVQNEEAAICSTEFMPFVPLRCNWRPFVYELMKSDSVQQGIHERVTGSTGSRQRAKPEDVAAMYVVMPIPALIEAFSHIVGPLHEKMLICINESRTLAALRDTLLPKLLSGELRVPDAERLCAEGGL